MAYTTINKSTDHFNTVTYAGNGGTNAITGVGFQPDLVWTKNRSASANHLWYDAVRGIGYYLYSNLSNAQGGSGGSGALNSFDSDGFTLGSGDDSNVSGQNGVAWSWKAGGGQGSSNTDGSINTTYTSANTTAGFSIIKYAGTGSSGTIGHGLSATPRVCILKEIDGTEGWRVWHRAAPNYSTKALKLNTNDAEFSQSNWIGTVDNSIITLGTDSSINTSGNNYICYAFAEKTGFSKFGSYTGNGSSSSPTFIYTGFKPKFVMVKVTNEADDWFMQDNKRDGYNDDNEWLQASNANAEGTNNNRVRLLSNGFSVPTTDKSHNKNGNSYIYMAFGQSLVGSNNVPCTAR